LKPDFGGEISTVNTMSSVDHRHLSNIDCLMAHNTCLVCSISTVNSRSKKEALEARH
jgi:hypothetical protein